MPGQFWEVIGGNNSGGILARLGCDVSSPELAERLVPGAVLEELESVGERIHFRRCTGTGPEAGWVSIKLKSGKHLLAEVENVWEVVNGAKKGGIVARTGQDVSSPMAPERLSYGAMIKEVELIDGRLHFKRLTGTGPASGWVSLKLQNGADLVRRTVAKGMPGKPSPTPMPQAPVTPAPPPGAHNDRLNKIPEAAGEGNPYAILQIAPSATDSMIKQAFRRKSLKVHPDQNPDDPEAATKFRELQDARAFLLDPVKRRIYNAKMNYLVDLANPVYWAEWQVLVDEIGDPELEDEKRAAEVAPASEKIDILVLGCTALTAMLGCDWMSKQAAGGPTWAMAGRSEEKVAIVAAKFGRGPNFRGTFHVPDPSALDAILPNVKVLVNYQGPPRQARTAEVIASAVRHGCHYIDITGDVPLHRDMIQKHDEEAKQKGLLVILHQGFTALPSDLIALCTTRFLQRKHATECKRAYLYTWAMGGGLSGTTFAAGLESDTHDKAGADDPFCLGGVRKVGKRADDADFKGASLDGFSAQWVAPDFNARGDTRIVRRTCELFEKESPLMSYGRNFNFKMYQLMPDEMFAKRTAFAAASGVKYREKLQKEQSAVPPVGSGPPERLRKEAISVRVCNAEGENGKEVHCIMRSGPGGFGDGYQSSGTFSVMIAHIILTEWDSLPAQRRGFVTAAYLLEESSIWSRLAEALMRFECHDGRAPQSLFREIHGGALAIGTDQMALEGQQQGPESKLLQGLPWTVEDAD